MSLYDGLDLEEKEVTSKKNESELAGWSSSFKLMHSQLQAKKASLTTSKSKKSGTTVAPVVDLRKQEDKPMSFNHATGRLEGAARGIPSDASPFIGSTPGASLLGVVDEYDPTFPNEFEDFMKKRKEQKREEERCREIEQREKRRKERHKEMGYEDSDEEGEEARRREAEKRRGGGGAAIAPPPSLLEDNSSSNSPRPNNYEDDILAMAPDDILGDEEDFPDRDRPKLGSSFGLAGSVASKIMLKYGYREGAGLGKNQQGMSMALQVEKTSKRGGKIIHERDLAKMQAPAADSPKQEQTNASLLRNPSKVLLLRNMVGPGEVDEDLEPETAEECSKYGKVNKCIIFEMPTQEEEEAVRIFLEFEKVDSAIKGCIDLNGRYFGGRRVKACFYNLDKFRRLDLADEVL